jgi:hypothetical protein
MKKILIIITLLPFLVNAQTRYGDFTTLNLRSKMISGSYPLISTGDTTGQYKYESMADPENELDGVNLRTLLARVSEALDTIIVIGDDTIAVRFYNDYTDAYVHNGGIIYFPPADTFFHEFKDKWLAINDTIYEDDSLCYFRPQAGCEGCWQFKHVNSNSWVNICTETGLSNLIVRYDAENCFEVVTPGSTGYDELRFHDSLELRTVGDTAFYKFRVIGKGTSGYDWQSNLGLLDNVTIVGYGAGATGRDTITDNYAQRIPLGFRYDSLINNTIIIGQHTQATKENQAVIGDTTIKELLTYGNVSAKGYQVGSDTLYTKHLILNEADSGKWLQHFGDSLKFENIVFPIDSFYINNVLVTSGDSVIIDINDADSDPANEKDSIQINGEWLSNGDAITLDPSSTNENDSIQINGEWLSNGDAIQISVIDSFIELTDTPDDYPSTNYGNGLIAGNSNVQFSDYFGQDNEGLWIKSTSVSDTVKQYKTILSTKGIGSNVIATNIKDTSLTIIHSGTYNYWCVSSANSTGYLECTINNAIVGNIYKIYGWFFKDSSYDTGNDSIYININGSNIYKMPSINIEPSCTGALNVYFEISFIASSNINLISIGLKNTGDDCVWDGYSISVPCGLRDVTLEGYFINSNSSFRVVDSTHNNIYSFPGTDGACFQALTTDGNGNLVWGNKLIADTIISLTADTVYIPSLRTDTIYIGNEAITSASDSLYFENDSTWLTNSDTLSIDTTNIAGLQTFVENHSTGGGSSQWEDKHYGIHYPNSVTIGDTTYNDGGNLTVWSDSAQWAAIQGYYYENTGYGSLAGAWEIGGESVITYGVYGWSDNGYGVYGEASDNAYSGYFYGGKGVYVADSLQVSSTGTKISRTGSMAEKDFWSGTQAEYDALGTYNENTVYFIYN